MYGLSVQQESILEWLLKCVKAAEHQNPLLLEIGIAWRPYWRPKGKEASEEKALENTFRASICRAVARLEKRGLVIRVKGRKKARTVRLLLTARGRHVAEAVSR